jgi:hypothetical protein
MATTTPQFGWSVPTSTDYVKDGAAAIETLGDAIDARFGNLATYPNQIVNVVSGVSRPVAYAMAAGTVTVSGTSQTTVTYPSGRFTQQPIVNYSNMNVYSNGQPPVGYVDGTTAFTVASTSSGTATIGWIAVQMKSATAAG